MGEVLQGRFTVTVAVIAVFSQDRSQPEVLRGEWELPLFPLTAQLHLQHCLVPHSLCYPLPPPHPIVD